jgi:hypothetical protein
MSYLLLVSVFAFAICFTTEIQYTVVQYVCQYTYDGFSRYNIESLQSDIIKRCLALGFPSFQFPSLGSDSSSDILP